MVDTIHVAAGAERLDKVFSNMLGKDEGKATLDYLRSFVEGGGTLITEVGFGRYFL